MKIYKNCLKRVMDFTLSLIAIIVFSPLFLCLYVVIKIKLGSPVIFKQERPGLNEKIFTMYKFRSMTDEKDTNGNFLPNELRLTSFGKKLRATSLDEIPEFFNVLKGDMSLIGPRPLLVDYLPYYTIKERIRHNVRPGITGWAQINGRNAISWEEKFKYDIEYVKKLNFLLDMKIVFFTIKKVLKRENISDFKTKNIEVRLDKYRENNGAD